MFKNGTYGNTQAATSNGSMSQHRVVDTVEAATTSTHIRSPLDLSPAMSINNSSTINSPGTLQDGMNEVTTTNTTIRTHTNTEQQLGSHEADVVESDTTNPQTMERSNVSSPSYTPHSPIMPYQPSLERYNFSASGSPSQQNAIPLNSRPAVDYSNSQVMSNMTVVIDDEETALPEEYKTLFLNAANVLQSMSGKYKQSGIYNMIQ